MSYNPEYFREYRKAHRDAIVARQNKWQRDNRDKANASRARHIAKTKIEKPEKLKQTKEERAAYCKDWRAKNPERIKVYKAAQKGKRNEYHKLTYAKKKFWKLNPKWWAGSLPGALQIIEGVWR